MPQQEVVFTVEVLAVNHILEVLAVEVLAKVHLHLAAKVVEDGLDTIILQIRVPQIQVPQNVHLYQYLYHFFIVVITEGMVAVYPYSK
ncbi:hypothetical protein SAMN02745134_03101 [Clostridium acidisoli DSM 12555]|uniref:Uncharacterized protein n=1 Tax=Clostridium acidisoli DSM 12555 TaxID=1121291 RepID=A0A1W1XTD7_9CLOT|nr:hypothetical protein SAMN02745134_03101 [Clostridium acidisoli DSM 12555]